jgi:hypothetical protein
MGDVMPTPTHEVEHHIHTGSHTLAFAKSHHLDPEKLEIAKTEFNRLESAGIVRRLKITMGLSFAHGAEKKILATLCQICKTFQRYLYDWSLHCLFSPV